MPTKELYSKRETKVNGFTTRRIQHFTTVAISHVGNKSKISFTIYKKTSNFRRVLLNT